MSRRIPCLHSGGSGVHSDLNVYQWMEALQARLRGTRICCGDWRRIMGRAVTESNGVTGVLLDPPYASARADVYAEEDFDVAHDVRAWALSCGDNPLYRIALCGYEGEHDMPETWECVPWKASGGYGNQRKDGENVNAMKERIWFSPHCYRPELF